MGTPGLVPNRKKHQETAPPPIPNLTPSQPPRIGCSCPSSSNIVEESWFEVDSPAISQGRLPKVVKVLETIASLWRRDHKRSD